MLGNAKQGTHWTAALTANAVVLGVLAYMAVLHEHAPDFYYMSVQEDEYLEWSTYCAFALAAGAWAVGAWRSRKAGVALPWFLAGLALFCFFVAGEEISWGQRLLAYRPPTYFLENNFQQELNVHNVIKTSTRKLALKSVIAGYGILLPLLGSIPPLRRLLARLQVFGPSVLLIPAFAATLALYVDYPWKYSGETVELMLGLCFLFAALIHLRETPPGPAARDFERRSALLPILLSCLIVFGLGLANAAGARLRRSGDPARVQAARTELEALRHDFLWMLSGRPRAFSLSKSLHKRVYTYEIEHDAHYLARGEFARLTQRGLPTERADFYLDPWNLPYWINVRGRGSSRDRVAFVYSFGPNRRRDSSYTEIRGDDVGAYIQGGPPQAAGDDD